MKRFFFGSFFLLFIPSLMFSFEVERICFNDDEVTVYWTNFSDTCDRFEAYKIFWRKSSGGNFTEISTIEDHAVTNFTQDPDNGGNLEQWEYFVTAEYQCGGNIKGIISDTIKIDNETPESVGLDSISVVNGEVVLGWSSETGNDIRGYNIYHFESEGNNIRLLDTVEGRNNSSYVDDSLSNPQNGEENFSLGAFDSCYNESPINDVTHSTIYLTIDSDSCQGRAEINWTPYEGWDVDHYKVLLENENNEKVEIAKVRDGDLSYTITSEDVEEDVEYDVFIRGVSAEDESVTSSSNRVQFSNNILKEPDYVYIRKVSVIDSNIHIGWVSSNAQDIKRYEIFRSQRRGGFNQVGAVSASVESQGTGSYIDSSASPERNEYFYRIRAIDICGQFVENSNISNSISLRLTTRGENNALRWNQYDFWEGGVDKYNIYRTLDPRDDINWKKIADVPFDQLEYEDTVPYQEEPKNRICYRVEAVEGEGNELTNKAKSQSNLVCFFEDAITYVPNAFRPAGNTNDKFNLNGLFIDYKRSEMYIYNRWGERIFHKKGIEEGWDGTDERNGEIADVGTYMYLIRLIGKNGQTETLHGTVQLLR